MRRGKSVSSLCAVIINGGEKVVGRSSKALANTAHDGVENLAAYEFVRGNPLNAHAPARVGE